MAARSPLRFLAPVAVVFVLVGVVIVVASTGTSKDHKGSAHTTTAAKPKLPRRHTYVVKAGDTLDAISEKVGVPTARLVALNPGLDPQALQLGDRIKIRP
jgi:LysM repeat protein